MRKIQNLVPNTAWLVLILCLLTWLSANPDFRGELTEPGSSLLVEDAIWTYREASNNNDYAPVMQSIRLLNTSEKGAVVRGAWSLDGVDAQYLMYKAVLQKVSPTESGKGEGDRRVVAFLTFLDRDRLIGYTAISRVAEDARHQPLEHFITVPPEATDLRLTMRSRAVGQWVLSDIRIVKARLSRNYLSSIGILSLLWIGLIGYLLVKAMARTRFRDVGFVVIVVLIMFGATIASQRFIRVALEKITTFGKWTFDTSLLANLNLAFAYGHVAIFMVLTTVFLLIADRIQVSRMHAIVNCLLLAVASEVLQRHSFSRNPQLADLFLDGLGIAIALAIYTFFTAKRQSP